MPMQSGISTQSHWLEAAILSPLSIGCLLVFVGLALLLVLLARSLDRLHRPIELRRGSLRNGLGRLLRDEQGTATMEFVLVTPLLLTIAALLAQTTVLMTGNMYVHYAAFAAARTAITVVPTDFSDVGGPDRNQVCCEVDAKYGAIKRAAAYSVVPISGQLSSGSAPSDAYVQAMQDYMATAGVNEPNWVTRLLPGKVRYAFANTRAFYMVSEVDGDRVYFEPAPLDHTYGPKDAITVMVEHDYSLIMPWIGWLYADGEHGGATGEGYYATMTASCTLSNEGLNPALPPLPDLPREP